MATRREFIHTTALVAGVAGMTGLNSLVHASTTPEIDLAVVDVRFAESKAFGEESARLGRSVVRLSGDVTRLWSDELARRWATGEAVIAGVTGEDVLFCLERMAFDHGHRVVARRQLSLGEQNSDAVLGERPVHWIIARPQNGQAFALRHAPA